MFVRMLQTLATEHGTHIATRIYEVPDAIGAGWIRCGVATRSKTPPPFVEELLARLDDGAGRPCLFLPPAGLEFGHEVMSHIRLVHFSRASRKIVCCRAGSEVLYSSAERHITDWIDPIPDSRRAATGCGARLNWAELIAAHPDLHPIRAGGLTPSQEIHPIEPQKRIPFRPKLRGLRADVVLGVRRRDFCPERNWPHWQQLADALTDAGLTFAVMGARPTTQDISGQAFHTGDFDTDAAIEVLQNCQLYIGTDSGSSHLASTVGVPMLVFREIAGGSRDLFARMQIVNHRSIEIVGDGWTNPNAVIGRARQHLDRVFTRFEVLA